jgi:hypothetical protein
MAKEIDTEFPERCPRLTPRIHCKKIETVPRKRDRSFQIITGILNVNLTVACLNQNKAYRNAYYVPYGTMWANRCISKYWRKQIQR